MNARNKPCWCGNGKKYKKCHLQADEVFDEATRINNLKNNFNGKKISPKLITLETIIQESMYYKYSKY